VVLIHALVMELVLQWLVHVIHVIATLLVLLKQ
jgi:hypothetical protein